MKIFKTKIRNNFIIINNSFKDSRGSFLRLYCKKKLQKISKKNIVQINFSSTNKKGTIRGLHYQIGNYKEEKFIQCILGSVLDVVVDLRRNSPTFLQYESIILSGKNRKINFIPEGCAHGFQTLEKNCELIYFHTNFYNKKNEKSISYNDPLLKIDWPLRKKYISNKDKKIILINNKFRGVN